MRPALGGWPWTEAMLAGGGRNGRPEAGAGRQRDPGGHFRRNSSGSCVGRSAGQQAGLSEGLRQQAGGSRYRRDDRRDGFRPCERQQMRRHHDGSDAVGGAG